MRKGDKYLSNSGLEVEIVEYQRFEKVLVKFIGTGFQRYYQKGDIERGRMRDPHTPSYCGIGYMGVGKYSHKNKKAYSVWTKMIDRCYNENSIQYSCYGGRGCYVADCWHNFQDFAEWYCARYLEGFELDKDIKKRGNLVYHPDVCYLIPKDINSLFISGRSVRGKYPIGVSKHGKKFSASVSKNNKPTLLGDYTTPEEAFIVYKKEKEKHIKDVANKHYKLGNIDEELHKNLISWEVNIDD